MELYRKVKLSEVNEQITCGLCKGYLIDATTILECLHTFCKSCIVLYIQKDNKTCPKCSTTIHHSYPLQHISFDRTMQDLVEKLVPNLFQKEHERKVKFHKERNLPLDDDQAAKAKANSVNSRKRKHSDTSQHETDNNNNNYHRDDEQVEIFLQGRSSLRELKRPYLQCSVHTTIKMLKKFLAKNLSEGMSEFSKYDILCNQEILGKDHTLLFILATRWRSKQQPLNLEYRPRISML